MWTASQTRQRIIDPQTKPAKPSFLQALKNPAPVHPKPTQATWPAKKVSKTRKDCHRSATTTKLGAKAGKSGDKRTNSRSSEARKSRGQQSSKDAGNRRSKHRKARVYDGPNATKDRIPRGAPESDLYFKIRLKCSKSNDDAALLKKLLPQRICKGKDFGVWPRQHPLLHGLVKQGCVECVRYLLSIGMDVNANREKDGCVPLHIAFYNLQGTVLENMVKMLLDEGADIEATNKWGEPPCMFKYKESIEVSKKSKEEEPDSEPEPEDCSSAPAAKLKFQIVEDSPCGITDFEPDKRTRGDSFEFQLGPPATPSNKSAAIKQAQKSVTFGEYTSAKHFEAEKTHLVADEANKLAQIVSMAASSYAVHHIAGQISDWRVVSHTKITSLGVSTDYNFGPAGEVHRMDMA